MEVIRLTPWDLSLAAACLLAMAGCTMGLRLGIARATLIAGGRMALQLCLLGLVLEVVFGNRQIIWIALIATVMVLVAGREVVARQTRRLRGPWAYGVGLSSMVVSSFSLAVLALTTMIQPAPWYEPRYAIPILGMLLGNTMNGVALVMHRMTQGAWEQRDIIEQRLMLGAPRDEAVSSLARDCIRTGMMPVINSMAVAGIVSLPGMMTGQILAGSAPMDAVKYQILIWLLIAAGSGFGMIVAVLILKRRLFDDRDRLRLDRLRVPNKDEG